MKKLQYILVFLLSLPIFGKAQTDEESSGRGTQFGLLMNVDVPFRDVMPNMSTTALFGFSLAQSPMFGSPFYIELKALWGNYSLESMNNIYYEKNGWLYPADSQSKSGYQKYLLGFKYNVGGDFRLIRGFATPQIGVLRMRSNSTINWTESTNNQNTDNTNTAHYKSQSKMGWVYGAEVGAEICIDKLLKVKEDKNTFRLLVSASYCGGFKDYSYTDVDKMIDPGQIPDATTPYVLVTHPKQWEDKYAEVYTSPLRLWGINLGLTINI